MMGSWRGVGGDTVCSFQCSLYFGVWTKFFTRICVWIWHFHEQCVTTLTQPTGLTLGLVRGKGRRWSLFLDYWCSWYVCFPRQGVHNPLLPPPSVCHKSKGEASLTSRSDMGVLSSSGRCCSRARTMQFAMMVAKIMYSKGVPEN